MVLVPPCTRNIGLRMTASSTYTTILFDLDHTLFDFDTSEAMAFEATLREAGVEHPDAHFATYDRINRQLWQEVERNEISVDEVSWVRFERLMAELQLEIDPRRLAASFATGLGEHGDLYPGAREVLELFGQHATLAMVTNGLSAVQRARIQRLELGQYFSAIAISAELGVSKPGSEIFEATFTMLNNPPKQSAVMIGDSLSSDIRGGSNFGIATCWYNPSGNIAGAEHQIDHEATSLAALAKLVTQTGY